MSDEQKLGLSIAFDDDQPETGNFADQQMDTMDHLMGPSMESPLSGVPPMPHHIPPMLRPVPFMPAMIPPMPHYGDLPRMQAPADVKSPRILVEMEEEVLESAEVVYHDDDQPTTKQSPKRSEDQARILESKQEEDDERPYSPSFSDCAQSIGAPSPVLPRKPIPQQSPARSEYQAKIPKKSTPSDVKGSSDQYRFHPTHAVTFKPPPGAISRCPPNARMFVGGVDSTVTTLDDIARMFVKYGTILEIMLKSQFAFVQFETEEVCRNAIKGESGSLLNGKKIDCSISKDRMLGVHQRRDRLRDQLVEPREGGRHDHRRREDSRDRASSHRARSRSPSMHRGSHGPSSRRSSERHPFPLRYGSQVPDVQIVLLDELNRLDVQRLETTLRQQSFTVDTLFLPKQVPYLAAMDQFEEERVRAVIVLQRDFERRGFLDLKLVRGYGRLQEHDRIDIQHCLDLLIKDRGGASAASSATPPASMPTATTQVNIASLLSGLASSGNANPQALMALAQVLQAPNAASVTGYPNAMPAVSVPVYPTSTTSSAYPAVAPTTSYPTASTTAYTPASIPTGYVHANEFGTPAYGNAPSNAYNPAQPGFPLTSLLSQSTAAPSASQQPPSATSGTSVNDILNKLKQLQQTTAPPPSSTYLDRHDRGGYRPRHESHRR